MKVVLVTGGFDPIHSGHINLFNEAKQLGDLLVVGINSDAWLERKKGKSFMSFSERHNLVSNIKSVDYAFSFDDSDGSAIDAIKHVRELYPNDQIIFANGGDRTVDNIPELNYIDNNLVFKFEVGGDYKMNSSSWILEEWKAPKTIRPWGYYRVLYEEAGTKVKELTVNPKSELSMQRHSMRSEYWHVVEGSCMVKHEFIWKNEEECSMILKEHSDYYILKNTWHQLKNPFDTPCKIIEIQFGDSCIEEDIERM